MQAFSYLNFGPAVPNIFQGHNVQNVIQLSEGGAKLESQEENEQESVDEEVTQDAVIIQEAMLQEGTEIDNSVLESLAGPPGQPQTIVLLSAGKFVG